MSDGGGGNKTFTETAYETLEEVPAAVAKPIQDEIGKAIETASQAIFGPTDPAAQQKKQEDAQKQEVENKKKVANIKQFLGQMAQDEQALRQQRQQEAQAKQQTEQEEQQEKQMSDQKKQQKDQDFVNQHIKDQQTRAEVKKGVGG